MTDNRLEPCRRCGSEDGPELSENMPGWFCVVCNLTREGCGTSTSLYEDRQEPIDDWNTPGPIESELRGRVEELEVYEKEYNKMCDKVAEYERQTKIAYDVGVEESKERIESLEGLLKKVQLPKYHLFDDNWSALQEEITTTLEGK
jgi:hypothetical protein